MLGNGAKVGLSGLGLNAAEPLYNMVGDIFCVASAESLYDICEVCYTWRNGAQVLRDANDEDVAVQGRQMAGMWPSEATKWRGCGCPKPRTGGDVAVQGHEMAGLVLSSSSVLSATVMSTR